MSTGIKVESELATYFEQFKLTSNKGRYIVLKISTDKTKIELETASEDPTFESYLSALTTSGEPRFSVLKFKYTSKDGRDCEKLISITW